MRCLLSQNSGLGDAKTVRTLLVKHHSKDIDFSVRACYNHTAFLLRGLRGWLEFTPGALDSRQESEDRVLHPPTAFEVEEFAPAYRVHGLKPSPGGWLPASSISPLPGVLGHVLFPTVQES